MMKGGGGGGGGFFFTRSNLKFSFFFVALRFVSAMI